MNGGFREFKMQYCVSCQWEQFKKIVRGDQQFLFSTKRHLRKWEVHTS